MTPPPDHPPEDGRALGALTKLAREAAARPTPAELERGLHALFGRMASRELQRARVLRVSLLALVASVGAGIGLHWVAFRQPDGAHTAPGYRIHGGSVLEGGYLRDNGSDGM
ncbi:MAG TPA: hypothetical protein VFQ61_17470, partial [Polyangiaceae bacterium]|nr:hypothetical protein [Polyangiaceae bacterium]